MDSVNMYELKHNGKINIWGWILLFFTLAFLIVSIIQVCNYIRRGNKDDNQDTQLRELQHNLRKVMGDKYESFKQ